jgi:import inner membrane translocase subunit TIM10
MAGVLGGRQKPMTRLEVASMELELTTDMFNRMTDLCYQKCVQDPARDYAKSNGDRLSALEMTCSDRCISKYLEAQQKIGEKLQEMDAAQRQQQATQAQMG